MRGHFPFQARRFRVSLECRNAANQLLSDTSFHMTGSGVVNYTRKLKLSGLNASYIMKRSGQWSVRGPFPIIHQPCWKQEDEVFGVGGAPESKGILPTSLKQYCETASTQWMNVAAAANFSGAF